MKAVKVRKEDGEKTRRYLASKNILAKVPIKAEKEFLIIPVTEKPKKRFTLVDLNTKKKEEKLELPTSFDTIGDIAILEVRDEKKDEKKLAQNLLQQHKNIKVIAKKVGIHEGVFRLQKLKILAGARRKETIHKENGIRLKLNVETCYFSPRLSTERRRIFEQVKKDESILVMFSGVGPHLMTISKNTLAKEVYGIEINPEAHAYALENIKLNKTKNVHAYLGDVREVLPHFRKKFDRIIMPLPKDAGQFLKDALKVAKKGTVIHLYSFLHETEIPKKAIEEVKAVLPKAKILKVVKCGQYSPGKFRICTDFKVQ